MNKVFVAVLLCCVAVGQVHAWGDIGHQLIAQVATSLLHGSVYNTCTGILGGQTLIDVATWADQVRTQPGWQWSAPLHYINTPDWSCDYEKSRDCADSMCVAGALTNYSAQCNGSSGEQQQDALKFVIHFAGDIHQPLHVGFTSDRGGNEIKGHFLTHTTDLHIVWDVYIITNRIDNDFGGDQTSYGNYLLGLLNTTFAGNVSSWASCGSAIVCPDEWANESAGLACKFAYVDQNGNVIPNNFSLGDPYYQFTLPVVEMQLAKSAVRLANALNYLYGTGEHHSIEEILGLPKQL